MIIGCRRKIKFKEDVVSFIKSRNKFLRKATIQFHFGVSSAQVYKILRELIKEGKVSRVYRKYYGLPMRVEEKVKTAKKSIIQMIRSKEVSCPDVCKNIDKKCHACVDFSEFNFNPGEV